PEYRTVGQSESISLHLKPDTRYMINPGSVGQPRDGDWRAAFALFDTDTQVVHYHRTPYDLKAAQDRILAANLPPRLATRLAAGRCRIAANEVRRFTMWTSVSPVLKVL